MARFTRFQTRVTDDRGVAHRLPKESEVRPELWDRRALVLPTHGDPRIASGIAMGAHIAMTTAPTLGVKVGVALLVLLVPAIVVAGISAGTLPDRLVPLAISVLAPAVVCAPPVMRRCSGAESDRRPAGPPLVCEACGSGLGALLSGGGGGRVCPECAGAWRRPVSRER